MPKILPWNLQHGGGSRRTPAIALSLLEHRADIVVLTEFRRTTGGQIAGVLFDHGLTFQHSTDPPKGVNGLLIAARSPLLVEPDTGHAAAPASVRAARQRRIAEVVFPDLGFALAGVHIPCDGRGSGREAVFQAALAAAARRRDSGFILIGDFNAGRHHLDEEGRTFTCTHLLGRLAALGYLDAWRRLHPTSRQYSWYSHEGGGFRIDHAFLSAPLAPRLTACWYSHNERESGLSDHSALVLELA
jgi:exonuclease III